MLRLDLGVGVLGAGAERGADGGLGQQGCIPLPPSLPPPMHEGLRAPPAVPCLCLWPRGVLAPSAISPPPCSLSPQPCVPSVAPQCVTTPTPCHVSQCPICVCCAPTPSSPHPDR